jgi:hypothetical protein
MTTKLHTSCSLQGAESLATDSMKAALRSATNNKPNIIWVFAESTAGTTKGNSIARRIGAAQLDERGEDHDEQWQL